MSDRRQPTTTSAISFCGRTRKNAHGPDRALLGALIDPGAEQADLFGGQAGALFGHDAVGVKALDKRDEETICAFAWHDNGARIAAFKQRFARVDAEAAFVFAAGVTLDATGFEDGFDFFGEIDFVVCGRGQLRELLRRESCGKGRGAEEKKDPMREAKLHCDP
jgi:hypothetical protein